MSQGLAKLFAEREQRLYDAHKALLREHEQLKAERDHLAGELEEFHQLEAYAKSLGQESYLALHARNERLAAELDCLRLDCDHLISIIDFQVEATEPLDAEDAVMLEQIRKDLAAAESAPLAQKPAQRERFDTARVALTYCEKCGFNHAGINCREV